MALSNNELRDLLSGTLNKGKTDDDQHIWVLDVFDDNTVVYEDEGERFRASFTINEDGTATIGEPERVKVEYVKFAELNGVEVFKPGSFVDAAGIPRVFTSEDVEQVFNNFNEIKDNKIPLVVSHAEGDEGDGINARTVGDIVVGYMQGLKKVGDTLLADFGDIAEGAVDKIGKTLVRISPELFLNFADNEGNTHGKAFRRISFVPRSSIRELADITGEHLAFGESDAGQETTVVLLNEGIADPQNRKAEKQMDPKLLAAITAIAGPDATPEAQADALVKLQESVGTLTTEQKKAMDELSAERTKIKTDKIQGFLTKLGEGGKVTPALIASGLGKFMEQLPDDSVGGVVKFAEGDGAVEQTPLAFFMGMLDGATPLIKLGEETAPGGDVVKAGEISSDQKTINDALGINDADYAEFSEAAPGTTPKKKKEEA